MRVQHNIAAMNSYRIYNNNAGALGKNLEKLSSGYRINRAGDDAAGLAISEKMRGQITGLNAATKNVKDGIALVQTAEGAMQEVHDMLGRMKYLATQSSNGTYQDEVDRENIQKEVDSLIDEIDRIADTANFNGQKLLDGSLADGAKKVSVSGAASTTVAATKGTFSLNLKGTNGTTPATNATANLAAGSTVTYSVSLDDGSTYEVKLTVATAANGGNDLLDEDGNVLANNATAGQLTNKDVWQAVATKLNQTGLKDKFDITVGGDAESAVKFTAKAEGADGGTITAIGVNISGTSINSKVDGTAGTDAGKKIATTAVTAYTGSNAESAIFTINGKKFVHAPAALGTTAAGLGTDVTVLNGTNIYDAVNVAKMSEVTGLDVVADGTNGILIQGSGDGTGLQLQIGDTGEKANKMNVRVSDMHAKSLGLAGLDVSTADAANASIDRIKQAIDAVSSTRGDLGAVQNRLEHTSNNLSVMTENLQNAESNIRDTDVADEMMKYTKNNILLQSAQAMLAQANQLPQGVLQLLQ